MKLLRAHGPAEFEKVASGCATQCLWLGDRKVGFQIVGKDQSQLPGRGTVGDVRKGGRRASDRTKERVHRFSIRFGKEKRASRLLYLSFGLGNNRRGTSGSSEVSLTVFPAFVSGSESHMPFTICFFHFSGPPGFRLAFDAAKRNERFGHIQCQRSKESSRGKRKRRVFLCRRTARVTVKSKIIPTSFLKVEGRGPFIGAKDRKKRDS